MIKEASVYALKRLLPQERAAYGQRILIMRRWPRGITRSDIDLWIPSAAPAGELLAAYRSGRMTWPDFMSAYRVSQVMASQTCRVRIYHGQARPTEQTYPCRVLDYLRELAQRQTITVMCWEAEESQHHCHRFVLQELLEHPEIEVVMTNAAIAGSIRGNCSALRSE